MKHRCSEIKDLLGPFADGELDEAASARVSKHIDECPECRREFEAIKSLDALVREQDPEPELAEDYFDWHRHQVWKRIRMGKRERRSRSFYGQRFLWLRVGQVAAGAAVVMIAVVAGWRLLDKGVLGPQSPMTMKERAVAGANEPGVKGAKKAVDKLDGAFLAETEAEAFAYAPEDGDVGEVHELAGGSGVDRSGGGAGAATDGALERTGTGTVEFGSAGRGLRSTALTEGYIESTDESRPVMAADVVGSRDAVADADAMEDAEVIGGLMAKQAPAPAPTPELAISRARWAGAPASASKMEVMAADVVEECDVPPQPIDVPALPRVSADDTGTVLLRGLVEFDGSVSEVEIEKSSGEELLDAIAVDNLRRARFRPGYQSGELVRCWTEVSQTFELEESTLEDAVLKSETDSLSEPAPEPDESEESAEPDSQ